MKLSIVILALVSTQVLAKPTVSLSFSPGSEVVVGAGASTRLFWCEMLEVSQVYQARCGAGCSSHSCDDVCTLSSLVYTCHYQCSQLNQDCKVGLNTCLSQIISINYYRSQLHQLPLHHL